MLDESTDQIEPVVSPDLFRLLVESVIDYAIFLLDPTGNVRSWNAGARRIKGYTADEIIGKHFSIFYPPAEVRRGKPDYALRVAADEGRWDEEGWRVRKDGSRFWASVVITALRDPNGTLVGFAKVTRDLSERRQAEEERRQLLALERAARAGAESSLEQLQSIQRVTDAALSHLGLDELLDTLLDRISEVLEVDTVAILLLDPDDGVLVARAAKGIEEEVEQGVRIPLGVGFAGQIVSERRPIILEDVQHAAVLNPILRETGIRSLMGVPLRIEQRIIGVLHVGTRFPRRFTAVEQQLLQIVGDRVALAIDHAQLYGTAQAARKEADISVARLLAQDEFLSIAAHELKTPMTGLKTAVQLLLRRVKRSDQRLLPELERSLLTIDQQTEKLARLTEQLLETARFQSDRLSIERQTTDLAELVQEVVGRFQEQTTQHRLVVSGPPQLWADIDPLRLEQVLSNLLENAIRYSGSTEPIEVELCQPHPRRIQLAVRDYGVGVPPEHRPHLFERFYQVRGAGAQGGLGLGLYISRRIIEQHGGMITAEFPDSSGSRFIVSIPIDADEDAIDGDSGNG
ncbi:MAG TPA: ATP-binding protein [Thermomicrobiaceae bacterium]|nr:ATP-binding protein [Thermomicrobiaceae bacterium]